MSLFKNKTQDGCNRILIFNRFTTILHFQEFTDNQTQLINILDISVCMQDKDSVSTDKQFMSEAL